mgnify:CR=1 FL=1
MNAIAQLTPVFSDLTPLPQVQGTPLPVAQGHDDSVMIFRSALLVRESQGADLRDALDRLYATHPQVAAKIVWAGSLGMIMWARAVDALSTYMITGVATTPTAPRSL